MTGHTTAGTAARATARTTAGTAAAGTTAGTAARRPVVDAIVRALAEVLDQEDAELSEDTRLFDDLGLGSMAVLELLLVVEESTGVAVDPEDLDIDHLRTVGSFADYMQALLEGAPAEERKEGPA